jgi:hypothetical protein
MRVRKRRTLDVAELVSEVNRRNRESTCSPEARAGWNALLEEILWATRQYAGYVYLQQPEVPPGEKPGVIRDTSGAEYPNHQFPDETRRHYLSP